MTEITELTQYDFFGVWASAIAVIISTIAASILALITLKSHEALKKKGETMKFIMHRSRDKDFTKAFETIKRIKRERIDMALFSDEQDFDKRINNEKDDSKINDLIETKEKHDNGVTCLNYLLNQYEYMAVGVKQGIYDEGMLKNASRTSMVSVYEITKPFINGVRSVTGKNTTYEEFEKLARRWREN